MIVTKLANALLLGFALWISLCWVSNTISAIMTVAVKRQSAGNSAILGYLVIFSWMLLVFLWR